MKHTILVVMSCICTMPARADSTVLHIFGLNQNDGENPQAGLTLDGSTLFGTASEGTATQGSVFSISTSGSNYTLLHSFSGASDGSKPFSPVLLQDGVLIGATNTGGSQNQGVLYSLNPDGSDFTLLHTFTGRLNDGAAPQAGVTPGDGKLFGTTVAGNNRFVNGSGTVYVINMDGSGFTLLHSFVGGANDGDEPTTAVTLSGTQLFGTTFVGGGANDGTIFTLNTDGTGFKLLHTFAGGASDGIGPDTTLSLIGSKLYGTTEKGGVNDMGTMFSMNVDGTGFTILHSFGAGTDGRFPSGDLTLIGSKLFGATASGGILEQGAAAD